MVIKDTYGGMELYMQPSKFSQKNVQIFDRNINFTGFEKCKDVGEVFDMMDYSGFELYALNDTHTYANGTWKLLVDLKSPLKSRAYAEYRDGDTTWNIRAFDRKYENSCASMKNPTNPGYFFFKNVNCPASKGVSL